MGLSKDRLIENAQKTEAAIEIAVRAGFLKRCENCEEVTDPQSEDEAEAAYRLANALFTSKDHLVRHFTSRKELTDLIKGLPDEFGNHCLCDRRASED